MAMSDSDPRSRAGKKMPASDRPARILLWVLVSAPRKIGGKCVEGRAAFLGPRWDRLAYRGEIRCREKIEKAWIGVVAHPSQGGGNTSQGRQASPTCETPERLRSGSDHGFDRDVHGVRSSAPTERCVVERAAVRTGKNS